MRHALILAGGGGTRLWPSSRRARPKQLLIGPTGESLIGMTVRRLTGIGDLGLVTAADQLDAIRGTLRGEGHALDEAAVVVEPFGRSTAAALGLAAVHALHRDPDAALGAFPADHFVEDTDGFRRAAERAFDLASREDAIVTIGIAPDRPDTGFGYLALRPPRADGAAPVRRFVEKPDPARAQVLIEQGCLWNGGMFFARAARVLAELGEHLPATRAALARVAEALAAGGRAAADRVAAEVYPALEPVSFDHGVMERTSSVVLAVRGDFGWNDVGAWPALAEWREADESGNVRYGTALTLGAHDNLVVTDDDTVVVLIGVDDLVVVRSDDAVLVVPRARAHDVKDAVAALRVAGLERYL